MIPDLRFLRVSARPVPGQFGKADGMPNEYSFLNWKLRVIKRIEGDIFLCGIAVGGACTPALQDCKFLFTD